ncbi:hypothetical protein MKW98_018249 [Papaver atlanticum]|uniref:Arf-GAP domain-containing protein n=1 Tax=Papaver atlanticum TaxID=357466 RepID=A0AAD4X807_9MAGN|nr:hypothetical protein MKW98_018249 [Papaver atlanticum]
MQHGVGFRSANIGVFLCLKCCGVHRSLGTYISKVLSVTLDDWSDEEIEFMIKVGGKFSVNSIPDGISKPGADSSHERSSKFIRCVNFPGLITLDDWSDEEIDSMIEIGGNSSANSTYDTFIPVGITKLGADSSHERSSKFIRA